MLKSQKSLFLIFILLLFAAAGCISEIVNEKQKIEVQKRIDDKNDYDDFKEITNNSEVNKVKKILSDIEWENAKVEMGHPPDYRFIFQFKNPDIQAKAVTYNLWISPNEDKVEIVKEEDAYSELNKENSHTLFEIITGESLPN